MPAAQNTKIEIRIRLPKPAPGVRYSGRLLDEIAERWLRGEKLPSSRIKIVAALWRWKNGPWKEARTPGELRKFREDFRFITYGGPWSFTTAEEVSPLG